ncbi:MAG: hypothetical protein C4519_04845 [Desulfobacteraceae bacterium]|nr:MAG: hypothetical protein C4519_04845 [Desulfobacteraceae bacterium]
MTSNEQDRTILCRLIRDHEDLIGSSRASMLALEAFIKSVGELKVSTPGDFREQYLELADAIKNTRPKIIPLIHLIEEFELEMEPHFESSLDEVRRRAVESLKNKHERLQNKVGRIIQWGLTCIQDGDVIIMHTASGDVMNMIALAKEVMEKRIKVIVLKQDFIKTKKLINSLMRSRIELETVPEFSLSHYIGQADKMFTGALSITHDLKVICAAGTANIASLCHFHGIPVYLFANTLKFSHGKSEDQCINEKRVAKIEDSCSYILTTYSHDMVDLEMVDYLVTEEGIFAREDTPAYVARIQARDPKEELLSTDV